MKSRNFSFANDFVLPTVLFAALGGMSWAVRGTRGFGGSAGCIFAGVLWGMAWWFCARDPAREQSRRFASGWTVLAITFGIAIAGARGWRQWSHFFTNQLFTNFGKQEFVPISNTYGFLWLFIAGVPWAGLGACFLAWCGSSRETRVWHWWLRFACGIGGAALARFLVARFPQYFLPLYSSIEDKYNDVANNTDLRRVVNDCRDALAHMGYYLGFLLFEVVRREWKNVVLILTVGIINGIGWAVLQNWEWAPAVWPNVNFAWWRCWESTGGISIGVAYGVAYFLVNRRMSNDERSLIAARRAIAGPNVERLLIFCGLSALLYLHLGPIYGWRGSVGIGLQYPFDAWSTYYFALVLIFAGAFVFMNRGKSLEERWEDTALNVGDPNLERVALYLAMLAGLGVSLLNGITGWGQTYRGYKNTWGQEVWHIVGPVYLLILLAILASTLFRPLPRNFRGDLYPRVNALLWFVLMFQNLIAQLVTGPPTDWNEFAFNIYYVLLFAITAVIVFHVQTTKTRDDESIEP